ncbi:MAG: aminotransferase class I/II-fold pyridoxal phosphate-dependent enzyme [Armatimonadota bacterium]
MSVAEKRRRLSRVAEVLPPSGIRRFFDLVATMPGVITLGVGEPDFPTPWHICDAVLHSLRRGETSYTSNYGLLELRQAIAHMLADDFGVSYDPESEILITAGVSEAIDLALRACVGPGDEVIVPEPCYVSYKSCAILAGAEAVIVPTTASEGFKLRPEALRAAVTERSRALVVGYPNNPTGAVMTREELAPIAQVAAEHDLLVISDEIYGRLTYEREHTCFASLPGMRERTILLNGFSKAYAMTGWRVGFAAAPADLLDAMMRIHSYTALCASTTGQNAALEALRAGRREMESMIAQYNQRRRLFAKGLNDLGLECPAPQGAFYAFPSVRATGMSSEEFCEKLLYEREVAAVPGTAFGACGEGHVRCSYATSTDNLKEALRRLQLFMRDHT